LAIFCTFVGFSFVFCVAGLPEGTRGLLELLHDAADQLMAGVPACEHKGFLLQCMLLFKGFSCS
jgi:hypothetical protein